MYEYWESQSTHETNPFGESVYAVGSDLLKNELGAYKEKLMGSYVQTNLSRYFSDPQYYFQVNDEYVKNKLKVILFPFLYKGHWMRTRETNGSNMRYKAPLYDINAPDLYIPLMSFGTYLVLAGFFLGINGIFSPEALGLQFTTGILCWLLEILVLEAALHGLGGGDIALLDVVAYGGYSFAAVSVALMAKIVWSSSYCYYVVTLWECLSMGVFLVKIMKRILIYEVNCLEKHSSKCHYFLLFVGFAQFPLLFWLANVAV